MNKPLNMLRHHVSGAIARGEAEAIVEQPVVVKTIDITPSVAVTIIRKSENINSFCLRGYWCVEKEPLEGASVCRVWEFATSENLSKGDTTLPFFTKGGEPHCPAFEVPTLKGTIPVARRDDFIKLF